MCAHISPDLLNMGPNLSAILGLQLILRIQERMRHHQDAHLVTVLFTRWRKLQSNSSLSIDPVSAYY